MTQKPKMTHVRFALTPPPRHRDRSGLCTREMRPCFFSPVQFYRNCQLYVSLFVCLYACICVCTCVIMKYGVICTIVCSLSPRRRHLACVTTDEKNSGPRFVIRPLNLISYTLGADYCVWRQRRCVIHVFEPDVCEVTARWRRGEARIAATTSRRAR